MKVLMVLTSHDELGNTGRKTGFWLEELAAPYYVFKDAGAEVTLASPKGGRPPLDPKSNEPSFQTDITRRFEKDAGANAQLDRTARLDSVKQDDYDTVFYPGGHGPMWDLAEDKNSIRLLESFLATGKTFAVVCHSTGALRHVKTPDGRPLAEGKTVTGFTNGEEEAVGLTKVVPFLVEDELMSLGATFSKVKNWGVHTVADGQLITGQNPASSGPAAKLLIDTLNKKARWTGLPMPQTHQPGQAVFRAILPEEVDWKPFSAFPPSVRLAVVIGEPSKPGPYLIRVKVPSGVKLMPHRHPEDRIYTVVSGVFYIGLGEEFDGEKVTAYPPGSVIVLPGDTWHFHYAKSGEYVTQVTAIGPLGLEYLDPHDDPRQRSR